MLLKHLMGVLQIGPLDISFLQQTGKSRIVFMPSSISVMVKSSVMSTISISIGGRDKRWD
jgi:hypothetical protein